MYKRFLPSSFSNKFILQSSNNNDNIFDFLKNIFNKNEAIRCKKGVIHIGAHKCEENDDYKTLNTKESTLWIDGNDELCALNPNIINALISDTDDKTVDFIITSNDGMSSSLLELHEHKIEHPDCIEINRIKKKTITLNTLFDTAWLGSKWKLFFLF
jgi:hypothetical protein